jgi:hypothetical protein
VNIYGVVIDAAATYKASSSKYITSLKLIDPTMHSLGNEANERFRHVTCIVYAKRLEDCPSVRNIGDVIRIHRANFKLYKGKPQFNVNIQFNSSWCLFDTQESKKVFSRRDDDEEMEDTEMLGASTNYAPYKFSGKSYSQDL